MYGKYFVLFAMMATGFILRRKNFINQNTNDGMNKFTIYVAFPCMLIGNTAGLPLRGELLTQFFLMLGISAGIYVLSTIMGRFYVKLRKVPLESAGSTEMAMVAPNNGFIGFPVTLIFFGQQGLLFMMAHNVILNIYLFSYGLMCLQRGRRDHLPASSRAVAGRILKIFVNPNLVALYIGFILALSGTSLAQPVSEYLEKMGGVATPLAMVYIGSLLADSNMGEMIRSRLVWEGALFKLILLPAVTALIVSGLPIPDLMKAVLILGSSLPTAANVAMLSQQERADGKQAGQILFFSTILSMATIPVIVRVTAIFLTTF